MQISGAASLPVDKRLSWIGSIALAIAVSVAYFFASRLSLELLTKPDGAGLVGDRSIAAAAVFALCNAGESLLVAWLIKRQFGDDFRLESLTAWSLSGSRQEDRPSSPTRFPDIGQA
jgi:hypothetical protein